MNNSTKKKSIKKADFQKQKLKVGRARARPTNFTETSFKSKGISLRTQSLSTTAPSVDYQCTQHLSLLSSHSGTQRSEHLSALTTHLSLHPSVPPPTPLLLQKLAALILDPDNRVRSQLVNILPLLPAQDIGDGVCNLLLRLRAGMTHLSPDVRSSSLDLLAWVLSAVPLRLVACAGGWVKTLKSFTAVLGWGVRDAEKEEEGRGKWTSKTSTSTGLGTVKTLATLATFLRCGLLLTPESASLENSVGHGRHAFLFPLRNTEAHMLATRPNAYGHLNLFGAPRDEEGEMYEDLEGRRRAFKGLGYEDAILRGVERMRKEGGEVGRAAGNVGKVIKEVTDLEGR